MSIENNPMSPAVVVHPVDMTPERLHQLLDAAYIRCLLNDDGDVGVREGYQFWVRSTAEGRRINLFAVFGFRGDATLDERMAFTNRVNSNIAVIRASVLEHDIDTVMFDWYLPVEGGITQRAIIYSVKLFPELITAALKEDTGDILA